MARLLLRLLPPTLVVAGWATCMYVGWTVVWPAFQASVLAR